METEALQTNTSTSPLTVTSIRIITADVGRLVTFYERVTNRSAIWATDVFAEISTPSCVIAIGGEQTVPLFGAECAEASANRSVIIEFIVEDVDVEYARLRELITEIVTEPTDMPWGNRALLFRDPDGNLINLFTPVSEQAKARFAPQL